LTGQLPGADERKARCRACSAAIAADAMRCDNCGAMQKDVKCPRCGAMAGTRVDREMRHVCEVCGAPRAPVLDARYRSTGKELAPLERAEAARRARAGYRAAAGASGALLAFSTAMILAIAAIFGMGIAFALTSLMVMGTLVALTAWSWSRANARTKEIEPALDAAWTAIATDVAQQTRGSLTAGDLAKALSIEEPQAEQLLALLDVNDVVKSDFTEDGQVAYSSRMRVDPTVELPTPAAPAKSEDEAAAEAEADAAVAAARTMLADRPGPNREG
jgi:hypothetical protein